MVYHTSLFPLPFSLLLFTSAFYLPKGIGEGKSKKENPGREIQEGKSGKGNSGKEIREGKSGKGNPGIQGKAL